MLAYLTLRAWESEPFLEISLPLAAILHTVVVVKACMVDLIRVRNFVVTKICGLMPNCDLHSTPAVQWRSTTSGARISPGAKLCFMYVCVRGCVFADLLSKVES